MANYLVASGSRKVSQLEIATNPVPAGSSSAMLLVIGDAFPATNATTVQITPDNFLSNLVFDASENYTGNNVFSGSNTFTGSVNVENSFADFSFETPSGEVYNTAIRGGMIAVQDLNNAPLIEAIRIRATNGEGFVIENATSGFGPVLSSSILSVGPSFGDVQIHRETHFSNDVYITGSLRVQEVFYVFETASIVNSSGSTSFGDTNDDIHSFTGSIRLSGSLSIIPGETIDGVDLSVFSSSVQAESQSFELRLTQDESNLSLLSASFELSSSQIFDDIDFLSSSFEATSSQIFDDIDFLSSSFETTSSQIFADIDYLSSSFEFTSSQIFDDIDYLSSSFESSNSQLSGDISLLSGSFLTASGSFSTRNTDLEFFSSSQYNNDSSSIEERLTQSEGDISLLSGSFLTDSGSFSTRITQNTGDISLLSGSFLTASGSFSTRVTTNEIDISQNQGDISLLSGSFLTASGSFSTRVTTNETNISQNTGDISLLSGSFLTASGSFSTRVTNNELTGSDHEDRIVKGTNAVTSSAVSSSYIDLDVLANGDIPAHKAGRIFFGSEDGALEVYNEVTDFTLQVGQEFVIRAYNLSGGVIGNGTPVFASGSQGDRIGIYPATAEDHTAAPHYDNHILGIATHEIGIASEGYVTAQGIVRGVDTQNFVAGDILYLQTGSPATPEDYYRNTPPPFPYDIVQVGYVARSAANGFIFAEPKEPVHFNNISGFSGSAAVVGDLWVYQENGSWTPTHTLTGSYTIGGDLLPETTEVHDLGSPSQRWRDIYLSGSTIDLGGLLIQKGDDGNVRFIDSASQATKSVSIDSITGSLDIDGSLTVNDITASGVASITRGSSGVVLNLDGTNAYDAETGIQLSVGRAKISGVLNSTGGVPGTTLRFYTMLNGGSVTENLRLESNGDLDVLNGNLVIGTAGKGIDFSATSDGSGTTTSELLDDYEEGTFTPTLTYATPGDLSVTYAEQYGYYTKIGRQVTCHMMIRLTAFTKGTATGNLQFAGLPFTSANLTRNQAHGNIAFYNTPTSTTDGHFPVVGIGSNSAVIEHTFAVNNNVNVVVDPDADSQYFITITYFTS